MKPLIKWAGGKSSEIKKIEKIIPQFERYIEPFFGGGAVFFDLEPKEAIINDITKELVLFYKLLKNGKSRRRFKNELYKYVDAWERINVYMERFGEDFIELYNEYKFDKLEEELFIEKIEKLFADEIIPFNGLFKKSFCLNQIDFLKSIEKNLLRKLKRTKEKIDTDNKFSNDEIKKNIESAFRSGFYTHFRNIMNKAKREEIKISKEKRVANYYFIREFCYGGMFRFNRAGDFNVPYGGIAYNTKDFRKKVDYIFSDEVSELLDRTQTENKDFEELLKSLKLSKKDFIFLDPPYDTEFSDYEENPFTREDQKRLSKLLINIKANWILIIKETDFIRSLYEGKKNIKIGEFDKEYSFNIKERIQTGVKHLVIHNLDIHSKKQADLFNKFFKFFNR